MDRFHESDLRKSRFSEVGSCYAITKVVDGRKNYLVPYPTEPKKEERVSEVVIGSLRWLHETGKIKCLGYTLMPDHLHLVFLLLESDSLSKVMESFSKFTARRVNKILKRKGQFWQHTFRDRMVRDDDELYNQLNYISENPVRAGFVEQAEDWPWSEVYPEW